MGVGVAHRRIGGVHVLAALPAGAVGVHTDFVRLDLNLDRLIDFRTDEDRSEGGVPPLIGVERRNSHQAMHPALPVQQSVGIVPFHGEGRGFHPRFLPGLIIVQRELEAPLFRPAPVHAQQHVRPVLRFRAPGAGVDGDNGVQVIGLAAEQRCRFQVVHFLPERVQFGAQLRGDVLAFAHQLEIRLRVGKAVCQILIAIQDFLETLARCHNPLGGFLILPDVAFGNLLLEGFHFLAALGRVKENSGGQRYAS